MIPIIIMILSVDFPALHNMIMERTQYEHHLKELKEPINIGA